MRFPITWPMSPRYLPVLMSRRISRYLDGRADWHCAGEGQNCWCGGWCSAMSGRKSPPSRSSALRPTSAPIRVGPASGRSRPTSARSAQRLASSPDAQWQHMTEHCVCQDSDGSWRFRYDPENRRAVQGLVFRGPDRSWPYYERVARPVRWCAVPNRFADARNLAAHAMLRPTRKTG